MKPIGKTRTILECLASSKAPTYGAKLGRTEPLCRHIVSRKLEMETWLGFGKITGNGNLNY